MLDILNKKIFRPDDEIFFLLNSLDKPHLYIRAFGKIIQRKTNEDNVVYLIQVKRLLVNVDQAKIRLHRRTFRTRKIDTLQAVMKKVYCFEYFNEPDSFSKNTCESLKEHLFVIPSVFVCEDQYELEKLYKEAERIIKEKFRLNLKEMEEI